MEPIRKSKLSVTSWISRSRRDSRTCKLGILAAACIGVFIRLLQAKKRGNRLFFRQKRPFKARKGLNCYSEFYREQRVKALVWRGRVAPWITNHFCLTEPITGRAVRMSMQPKPRLVSGDNLLQIARVGCVERIIGSEVIEGGFSSR